MAKHARWAMVVALAGASAVAACSVLLDFSVPERAGSPDGAADAPGDGGPPPDPCEAPPTPPKPDGTPGGAEQTFYAALSSLSLGGETNDAGVFVPLGLNLDRRCTGGPDASSCVSSATPQDFERYVRDGDGGADIAFFGIYSAIRSFESGDGGGSFDYATRSLQAGRFQLLFRVRGYNGLQEDDNVSFDVFPSFGKTDDGGIVGPADSWTRDPTYRLSDLADQSSTLLSIESYVRDGQLVGRFPLLEMNLVDDDRTRPLRFRLRDAVVLARIASRDGRHELVDGVLAGRVDANELLTEVGEVLIGGGRPLCTSARELLTSSVCAARDLAGGVSQDNTGAPCVALSAAMRFQTYAVDALGPFVPPPERRMLCDGAPLVCP